jgi:hypothetical protein
MAGKLAILVCGDESLKLELELELELEEEEESTWWLCSQHEDRRWCCEGGDIFQAEECRSWGEVGPRVERTEK